MDLPPLLTLVWGITAAVLSKNSITTVDDSPIKRAVEATTAMRPSHDWNQCSLSWGFYEWAFLVIAVW
jgi:hypothetical protein